MKVRISSYRLGFLGFGGKIIKKKIQNKTKASYKVEFYAFLFSYRDCYKVGKFRNNELINETFVFETDFETDFETNCEILWCEIIVMKPYSRVLVGVFYRPPSNDIDYLKELERSLFAYQT